MEHEKFPVKGFEFMDEPATEKQKEIIVEFAKKKGLLLTDGPWPEPFSKWDAANMIKAIGDIEDEDIEDEDIEDDL